MSLIAGFALGIEKVTRVDDPCDQCVYVTPATETRAFDLGGIRYRTQLCASHAAQFDDSLQLWADMASCVLDEPEEVSAPTALALVPELVGDVLSPREENAAALTEIRSIQERAWAKARREQPGQQTEEERVNLIPGLIDNWTIGVHTRRRSRERNVSMEEILEAVLNPHYTVRSKHDHAGPDVWVHHRGNIKVVVDREAQHVWTVADKDASDEKIAVGQ